MEVVHEGMHMDKVLVVSTLHREEAMHLHVLVQYNKQAQYTTVYHSIPQYTIVYHSIPH